MKSANLRARGNEGGQNPHPAAPPCRSPVCGGCGCRRHHRHLLRHSFPRSTCRKPLVPRQTAMPSLMSASSHSYARGKLCALLFIGGGGSRSEALRSTPDRFSFLLCSRIHLIFPHVTCNWKRNSCFKILSDKTKTKP